MPVLAANFLDPTASYRDVTFATLGDKTVSAECGNTKTVNVKVLDLVVEFSPGEARPGIGTNRVKTVTATAKRTAGNGAVTIDLSTDNSRATVSPNSFTLSAGQATQNQQLTIQGTALSQNDRDTNLIAKVGADTVGKMPITVVAPKNWTNDCLAAPLTGGPAANTNNENPPPKDWEVRWVVPVTFTVLDQFEKPLDLLWVGVLMFERVVGGSWHGFDANNPTAGTPIDANAQATDPVQYYIPGWTENDAKIVARKEQKPWPMGKLVYRATLEYKIMDGGTSYSLEKSNERELRLTKDSDMTVEDVKEQ